MKKSILKFAIICSLFFTVSFSAQAQFIDKGEVIGSGDLGINEAIDGLVAYRQGRVLMRQPACDLLG